MLEDKDPHVRFTAARALAVIGDAGIVETLVASLDDRQVCLGIMGDYTPLSGSASAMSKYEIFQAESGTGTFTTVYQGTSYLCEAAADRLSRIGRAQATEALMSGLKHQTELVRSIAALALVRLGDNRVLARLFSVLNRAEYDEAQVFEGALAALGQRIGESYARQAGAEALGRLGDPRAVPHLIEVLSDRQRSVGAAAARALREFDPSQVTEVLIETLKPLVDEDAEEPLSPLSPSICWTLGQFRAEQAIPLLMEAIWCRDAVHAAAEVLIEIGNPPADPLIDALEAEENWVREAAAHVLCELGPRARDAVPDLVQALEEESESVRSVLATALGTIGGKRAAAALVASHQDGSARVREAVEKAFIALSDISQEIAEELFPVLEAKNERMRLAAALAIGQSAQIGLVDQLGDLLEDKNWRVRQGATYALGIMGMELTMKGGLDSPGLAELV
jgi:HEAT repeat protein